MHESMNRLKAGNAGFTLTELAIVMIIMALLIGGMMLPLSAQQDIRQNADTMRQLDEIREALLGFAITNGYFPCPAKSTSDGNEDRNSDTKECVGGKRYGLLPWITLGIKPNDSWGHLFIYSVSPKFSGQKITLDQSVSKPDITIQTRDAVGDIENLSNSDDIPAVVLSTGKNGYWSWTLGIVAQNADSTGSNDDEDTNADAASNGRKFVSRTPTGPDAGVGEFDDLVTWVSPNVLFNRMVAANRLP
jgi:prepilin-type N-terminal cleavage/methylation domain-containing protein